MAIVSNPHKKKISLDFFRMSGRGKEGVRKTNIGMIFIDVL